MITVSGITPSGRFTLGNYLGALRRANGRTRLLLRRRPSRLGHPARPEKPCPPDPRDSAALPGVGAAGGVGLHPVSCSPVLAIRFNTPYGLPFEVPELHRAPAAGRLRDLLSPTAKMSKSDPDNAPGVLRMRDSPKVLRRTVMRAVTDSGGEVRHDDVAKPAVTNLLEILAACTGTQPAAVASGYTSYGDLKSDTADAVVALLEPAQHQYAELQSDPWGVGEGPNSCRRRLRLTRRRLT